jgi:phosphotransferase system enzyme I (PtsI)
VGVGLFRSEFLFMGRGGKLPGEEEQYQAYRAALEGHARHAGHHPHHRRGRRQAAGRQDQCLAQPALGLRAIRWSLAEPVMFRTQLRAILRAAAWQGELLFPCWRTAARSRRPGPAAAGAAELDARGVAYGKVELGAMIEIPAAALMVRTFLQYFDFLSIGTNDLIQYTLAIDRADEAVAHLYDPLHPAVLQLVAEVIARPMPPAKASACAARWRAMWR